MPALWLTARTRSVNATVTKGAVGMPRSSSVAQCTATAGAQVLQWPMAMITSAAWSWISCHRAGSSSV